ncbi:MAG: guanylate kinase [Candidatus Omnitrophica bacterium]|nr:guanylate kinase [Candidatus Omnitrophota bacterium]
MKEKRDSKETGQKKSGPLMIIVSAPSGGGKTTIVNDLVKNLSGIKRSVSYTTRKPRKGEKDGEDYIFVCEEEFRERIGKDEFLEWERNFGNYYGTSKKQVNDMLSRGDDVVLSIDIKGARQVRKKYPESVSVFIMPPSIEELALRLEKRNTEEGRQMAVRVKESRHEMESADEYDYLLVNAELDKATGGLRDIVKIERENRQFKIKR